MRGKARRFFLIAGGAVLMSMIATPRPLNSAQTQTRRAAQDAVRLQKPIQHEVSVVLKLIQVVVTDKNGNPVTDLRKEDFALTDNGDEKKLTEFERHDFRLPAVETKPADAGGGKIPPPAAVRPPSRKFFLLFDFALNYLFGVRKMGEVAKNFLDTAVLPGDEVAVLTMTALKLLQVPIELTTDHEKIRRYVAKIGLSDSSQRSGDLEDEYQRQLKAGDLADARPEGQFARKLPEPPAFDVDEMNKLSYMTYVDCLNAFALFLGAVPGPKHLVLFSTGIPYSIVYPSAPNELTWKYENLIKTLATSNVAVHALRTAGITLGDTKTGAWTLDKTSYETGGQYWGNMYNYRPFTEKIRDIAGAYYVLGYPVRENWDGKFHKIKVRVARPDCKVKTSSGFLNPKEYADFTNLEKQVHLIDLALAEKPFLQEPLRFSMIGLTLSPERADNIGIAAEIPLEQMRTERMGRVEILRLAFNAAGEIVDSRRSEENVEAVEASSAVLASFLSAPPGLVRCRIIIRDLDNGRAAVAGFTARVPDPAKPEFRIYPPLLLRAESGRLVLKEPKPARKDGTTAPKTPDEAYFLDPARFVPDFPAALKSETEVWAVLSCIGPPETLAKATLTLTLLDEFKNESHDVPLVVAGEKAAPGSRIFLVHFRVPQVEPDNYLLIFAAQGPNGPLSQIAREFSIESRGGGK